MLVDSHCHLNFIDLASFDNELSQVIARAEAVGVKRFLSVCVDIEDYPVLQKIADTYPQVSISVGVHPNSASEQQLSAQELIAYAKHPSCIAIGETGLDYYRSDYDTSRELQQVSFREHILAAIASEKPLIIHTRQAAEDTLSLMKETEAARIGGVMHCFAEGIDVARACLDMNFYISFSGIVTFKNATALKEVAKFVPLDRILIETDAPYLAPVPFRGKQNHPALVKYVADYLSELRGIEFEVLARATTDNFHACFRVDK